MRLFKRVRLYKPKASVLKHKVSKKTMRLSLKGVEKWWDYLLTKEEKTQIDRNVIYWKYKPIIDEYIDPLDKDTFFTSDFKELQPVTKKVIRKLYEKERKI